MGTFGAMKRRKVLAKAFGAVVREARTRVGLSQERLAFKAGIHPTYLSRVERGVKSPTLDVVDALARGLHIKSSSLIQLAEEHTP